MGKHHHHKHHRRCPDSERKILERMLKACGKDIADIRDIECFNCICCCDKNRRLEPDDIRRLLDRRG